MTLLDTRPPFDAAKARARIKLLQDEAEFAASYGALGTAAARYHAIAHEYARLDAERARVAVHGERER